MRTRRPTRLLFVLLATLLTLPALAEEPKPMRGEDLILVPAISEGLCVSNTFQSNMVLQRDKPITIWGWADAGNKVTVSFGGNNAAATAEKDRYWKAELPALPANDQPQVMTIKAEGKTLTLDNVLVGDVWVLGGQSNMEFELAKVENGHLEIISANFPEMRILSIPQGEAPTEHNKSFPSIYQWSSWSSRHFKKGTWDVLTPEIARELSAIGYVFARRIHMATKVPIGVIDASRGGTTVETWTPQAVLRRMDSEPTKTLLADWDEKVATFDPKTDLANRIEKKKQWIQSKTKDSTKLSDKDKQLPTEVEPGPIANHNHPGSCYGGMIAPLEGLSIKGAIFHQGFNNAFSGQQGIDMYADVFPEMIKAWRGAFNDPEMPFGILSLCTAGDPQLLENYSEKMFDAGVGLRAAQYKTFEDLYKAGDKNIGFVSTYDLRRRWYHPQVKLPAGERAARWALATQYGYDRQIAWKPPMLTGMAAKDGSLVLSFDQDVMDPEDGPILGFAIAGEAREFHPATASYAEKSKDGRGRVQYDKKKLVLTSIMVPDPIHFRFAWSRNPLANLQLTGNKDVPFATQKSDDWGLEKAPLSVIDSLDGNSRASRGKIIFALKQLDRKRKLQEAQIIFQTLGQE
ncbi:MAG: sialate O-acetylesterase [Phycisphaeraceae bacterium]|nr:sialate O-acetylesterase [Phycisphaeraceae bacterium]